MSKHTSALQAMKSCKYCGKPNKTIVTHASGVEAFVGAERLWLRFYDSKLDKIIVNLAAINYCPMCGKKLKNS